MKNLQITSSRFITYTDSLLTVDVLGGVDTSQVERPNFTTSCYADGSFIDIPANHTPTTSKS